MAIFLTNKKEECTPFSDFFRNAPSKDKKRVYARVIEKATERQQQMTRAHESNKQIQTRSS